MNDRFSAQLRQHLLATADERPADGRLEAIDASVAVTAQRHPLVARLPWFQGRVDPFPSPTLRFGLVAVALVAALSAGVIVVGGLGAKPTQSVAIGGLVRYQLDGAPATTEVDAIAEGASMSGTAVTQFQGGTHTVRLGCATRSGDTWALGGKIEQTTVPAERVGDWSAVIVKDGSSQQIAIWLSDGASNASECEAWLASIEVASIGIENFNPVESGALVPPLDPS